MTDKELVDALCAIEKGLTEWEVEFVESVSRWLDTHECLSAKQRKIVEKIYDTKA